MTGEEPKIVYARPAAEGIAGFLADHLKVVLHVEYDGGTQDLCLFVKRLPVGNQPKMEFIEKNQFNFREMIMFQLLDHFIFSASDPWCPKALLCNEKMLVLPDLTKDGYCSRPQLETLDLPHVLTTTTSLARFHASFAKYEVRRTSDPQHPYNVLHDYGTYIHEPTFIPSSWLRACAKLSVNLLNTFSSKYQNIIRVDELYDQLLKASDSLKEHEDTLNVIIHKDLWVNNIMFKYEKARPANAILIDFQCIRYAPPAFDVMCFLYLTTSRSFKKEHEETVLNHYFTIFCEELDERTKEKVLGLKYDRDEFLRWCEKARQFGIVLPMCIFPYILMDPVSAQKTYDNPATYDQLLEDRTVPVLAHADKCPIYKERQVELIEEFVERYMLKPQEPHVMSHS
ncbi:hypothetical protein ACJJTC_001656 [Scirpophaga incertulas]